MSENNGLGIFDQVVRERDEAQAQAQRYRDDLATSLADYRALRERLDAQEAELAQARDDAQRLLGDRDRVVRGRDEALTSLRAREMTLVESDRLLAEARQERDRAVAQRDDVRRSFDLFQEQVREVAIRVAKEQGWCDRGLNEVLAELGLPGKLRKYRATMRLWAYQDVTVFTEATDEDIAHDWAKDGDAIAEAWDMVEPREWQDAGSIEYSLTPDLLQIVDDGPADD